MESSEGVKKHFISWRLSVVDLGVTVLSRVPVRPGNGGRKRAGTTPRAFARCRPRGGPAFDDPYTIEVLASRHHHLKCAEGRREDPCGVRISFLSFVFDCCSFVFKKSFAPKVIHVAWFGQKSLAPKVDPGKWQPVDFFWVGLILSHTLLLTR